ncbi:MAG: aminotransferase class I/II-fold pyridoxal phosphate-dependent enzyme [Betaproteobacteria bacterium]|nr:aminotransferase class I/II-fold pyridoxal phosphate-dependent enzyme [Betaproteobacteria bacterium]
MSGYDFLNPPQREDGDSAKWAKYAGRGIIPAWVADMDFAAAPPIVAAIKERAAHGVFGYAEPPPQLRETVAEYFFRRWEWQISPEWLVFLPGLGPAIYASCRLAEGGAVITPSPIYHAFRRAPAPSGARRTDVQFALDNGVWKIPDDVLSAAVAPDSRVLQLCNPHNPNGKVYTREELLQLGEFCLRHNLILCADEVHADLILDADKKHICIAALDKEIALRTIVLQSPSKTFNIAGLNFAAAVIPGEKLRRRFCEALAGKVISNLNPFGMAAATAAWGGACDDWLAALIKQLRANRDLLAAAKIAGITMPHLSATYLAWLRTRESGLAAADFERAGVGMSAGESFGDADYMRLNFGCAPALLKEIIRRLQSARPAQNARPA